jgi:hypothetical protein
MRISKRTSTAVIVAGSAALSMALAVGASGAHGSDHPSKPDHTNKPDHLNMPDHPGRPSPSIKPTDRGRPLIKESLAPSQLSDPTFHGVSRGAAPWVLKAGEVRLKGDGKLNLRVQGLVIPSPPGDGTPGPVNTISASLYCGAETETAPADTTQQVPISRKGDARIHDKSFSVPAICLAPEILVHPNGDMTHYIAVDGWRP